MASPNLTELVTTTLRNRSGALADNVTNNTALLRKLRQRGNMKMVDGGRTIVQELAYAENGTVMWYSGYEALDISPSDVMTAAEFDYKQLAVAVTISGLEMLQNSGKNALIDLLESRIQIAEDTMANTISEGIYADGTGNGGKEIGGLQLLVADDPTTGVVGGINRANYSFWQNGLFDISVSGSGAASSSNIQGYMNRLYNSLVRGTDKPDLIIADNNFYRHYEESLQAIQRISSPAMADAGYESLKYKGADVVLDGGKGGNCPSDHMYFLNTKYIHYRPHRQRHFVPLGDERFSTNQDAMVQLLGWTGNMTLSNASLQGVMIA